jgi:hypothetical protein
MSYDWFRGIQAGLLWGASQIPLVSIPAGDSYVRCRFRWGFYADTSTSTDLAFVSQNLLTFGLVTTIGNLTEPVPNPRTQAGNQAPPAQRWLYWETRAPVITAIDAAGSLVTWQDSGSSEMTETQAQVKAPIMPSGDSLNLWASIAQPFSWDPSGSAQIWFGWEVLVKIPL